MAPETMPCREHSEMIRRTAETATLAAQLNNTVQELCHNIQRYFEGEGPPLLVRRLDGIEAAQREQSLALRTTADTLAGIAEVTRNLQARQDEQEARKTLAWDRSTKVLVAIIALGGPIIAAASAALAVMYK